MAKDQDPNTANAAPWQVGVIVTVVVALIGALATIYASGSFRGRQEEKPSGSLKILYEAEVRAALDSSRIAVDEAFTKLDPEPLKKHYSGDALTANLNAIRRLKEQDTESLELNYIAIRREAVDIFNNPLHARVRETIKKTIAFYQKGKCYRTLPFEAKTTVYLRHSGNNWVIYSVDVEQSNPEYFPCS